jgi:hypothetical protein
VIFTSKYRGEGVLFFNFNNKNGILASALKTLQQRVPLEATKLFSTQCENNLHVNGGRTTHNVSAFLLLLLAQC